jgi:hypothetical protein
MGAMLRRLPIPVLSLILLLRAGVAAAQPGPQPATVHMSYTGTAYGLSVLKIDADLTMDGSAYRIDLAFHTVGLLAVFVSSEIHSTTWGSWQNGHAEPRRFWSWGHLRGAPRETLIDYRNGLPVIARLTPSIETDGRDPVSEPERDDTVDTLSAIVFLIHEVASTGTCEGDERVFDGRRLTEIDAHTVGQTMLARGESGPYQGETLRCDFIGREVGGFKHDGSTWQHQPHNGAAWLAKVVPDGPPIPVRLNFSTRWVNNITIVLNEAGPGLLPQP